MRVADEQDAQEEKWFSKPTEPAAVVSAIDRCVCMVTVCTVSQLDHVLKTLRFRRPLSSGWVHIPLPATEHWSAQIVPTETSSEEDCRGH